MLPYLVFSANIHFHFLALSEVTTANGFKKKKLYSNNRLSTCDRASPLSPSDPELIVTLDARCPPNLLSFLSSQTASRREKKEKKSERLPV